MAAEEHARPRGAGPSYRWIDDSAELESLVEKLATEHVYALDTEFHRERTYFPRLALVQVGWSESVALVDALAVDVSPLARALTGDGLAVLHAAEQDLEVLYRACGAVPSRLFDTQLAAGFIGLSSPSLSSLVEKLLGKRIVKADRLTDWTRRPLSLSQREYAASDVAHLLDLHRTLVEELATLGRLAWAEEECELLLRRSRRVTEPEKSWWKLKDARQLRKSSRGIAQEVAAWRERVAMATDRPARFVLPDLALTSIAQRPPSSKAELRQVRGMDGRRLKPSQEDELLMAIERGRKLEDSELQLPATRPPDRDLRAAAALAGAWVARRAAKLRIDTSLVGTRADLSDLLRGDPGARMATGWRWQLLGAEVAMLASGEAALAVDNHGDLVLEARSRRPAPGGEISGSGAGRFSPGEDADRR